MKYKCPAQVWWQITERCFWDSSEYFFFILISYYENMKQRPFMSQIISHEPQYNQSAFTNYSVSHVYHSVFYGPYYITCITTVYLWTTLYLWHLDVWKVSSHSHTGVNAVDFITPLKRIHYMDIIFLTKYNSTVEDLEIISTSTNPLYKHGWLQSSEKTECLTQSQRHVIEDWRHIIESHYRGGVSHRRITL